MLLYCCQECLFLELLLLSTCSTCTIGCLNIQWLNVSGSFENLPSVVILGFVLRFSVFRLFTVCLLFIMHGVVNVLSVAYNESYEKKYFKFLFITSTVCPLFCGNGISDWSYCKCEYDGGC